MITLTNKSNRCRTHMDATALGRLFINSPFSQRYENCEFQELSHALYEFTTSEEGLNSNVDPGTFKRDGHYFRTIEKMVFEKGIKLCNSLA